jgi:hypothetical protein
MRTHGVVDLFPVPQLTIEFFHLQRASRDLVELLGMGAVGAFDGAIEFGRAQGQHEQMQATLLAGEFELGGELASAIDLHRPDGEGHAVLTTPGRGRTSRVSTCTRSPGRETAYCLGLRTV